jgi:hypothetical protein
MKRTLFDTRLTFKAPPQYWKLKTPMVRIYFKMEEPLKEVLGYCLIRQYPNIFSISQYLNISIYARGVAFFFPFI